MTEHEIAVWLNEEPTEIEWTDDLKPAAYIPIWAVENYLDILSDSSWERYDHKYVWREMFNTTMLSTSHLLKVRNRVLLCSSIIDPAKYQDSGNLLQTGIAEATKAGVKVLGRKFGRFLNERNVLKPKPDRVKRKAAPDAQIMKAYLKAMHDNDIKTIERLVGIYDIKTEVKDAT